MEFVDKLMTFTQRQSDYRLGLYRLDLAVLSLLLETGLVAPEKAIERFQLFLDQWTPEEQAGPKGSALKGAIDFVRIHSDPDHQPPTPKFDVILGGRRD